MKRFIRAFGFVAAVLAASEAAAAEFPERQITMIVSSPAGGAVDALARVMKDDMQANLGVPVVIENRDAGGGTVAAVNVARSKPDGYVILMAAASTTVFSPFMMADVGFDTLKDFRPVTLVATLPTVLVANRNLPVASMKDLVALAKQKPGQLNFSSAGAGSASHLSGELMNRLAGMDIVHIPYQGAAQATTALLSGEADLFFSGPLNVVSFLKTGEVKPLLVTDKVRLKMLPDVPTAAEAGVPGLEVTGTFGIYAPAGIPKAVSDRIHAAAKFSLETPHVRDALEKLGYSIPASGSDEFRAYLEKEIALWGKIIKEAGIAAQ